ncbi:MAG: hypothetical protein LBM98_10085 [Oscillospiraceae bacterium]|jgi:Mrp family chromosome partitioning ATPase|nr:hypothetical protein [Oscillospiraceae bacterium]
MKLQLLIASGDKNYADRLSSGFSQKYEEKANDLCEVSLCSTAKALEDALTLHRFDAALIEPLLLSGEADLSSVRLPLLLVDEGETVPAAYAGFGSVRKYQRATSLVGDVLELYAKIAPSASSKAGRARITSVYSPAGGTGKTTVALAYAAAQAAVGRAVTYFPLEPFSSVAVYFATTGRSFSTVLGYLDEGNPELQLQGIRQKDDATGISYFCPPDTYDDIAILTVKNITDLIGALLKSTDELVIDLPTACDTRTRAVLEHSERVLLVTDGSRTSGVKLEQFIAQHNVFEDIRYKTTIVANKGAAVPPAGVPAVTLPFVPPRGAEANELALIKALSAYSFEG